MENHHYRIADLRDILGITGDTLRYYEKIGLLNDIGRTPGSVRFYNDKNVSSLRFIIRAKSMDFTLDEIKQLLLFREAPQDSRIEVQDLTRQKLKSIENKAVELDKLRKELTLLLNLCGCTDKGCPIIESIDTH
ncbi:MAG: heavy metal-responsive transcriptional regulator [Piscirickettsiaceae bacterium]|nr:MAG: heavy metal-responsive transcriptional regulator [Piscirickettsiaceae bacterium]